jgi:hypothetical protein
MCLFHVGRLWIQRWRLARGRVAPMTWRVWCLFALAGLLSRLPWTRTTSRWADRLLHAVERERER